MECEGGGCGSRYANIICIFCTRNETILPFMSAKMSWMSSPNSKKHVQVICIFTLIWIIIISHMKSILITVGQGPTALAAGAGGGCLDIFSLIYPISILSPSLWETARYRLKYCLKGPLNPKQPTSHYPKMSRYLINESKIKLVSLFILPQSSFIYIGLFTIFIAIHVAHLNTVYVKATFCTGGWGKPILIYHMIDRLSIIGNSNDRQKVKDNI